jgi:hypothetical protein
MTKKAFLVGINDYYPIGPAGQDLSGCVNDVRDMANTLVICGFEPKNIRICTDERATKKNIIKGITDLISNTKDKDSIVFYYSGHGSQVPSSSKSDEIDQFDEVLCPHDMDFSNQVLKDDELALLFSKLPKGVNLECLLDCCHSGTATKEVKINLGKVIEKSNSEFTTFEEFSKPAIQIPRYMVPPIDVNFHLEYNPDAKKKWLMSPLLESDSTKRRAIVSELNHTLWAGCKDDQLSYETDINGYRRGIFTFHLCEILRRSNGDIKRNKLYKLLNAAIQRTGYSQNPQLETSKAEMLDNTFF